MDSVSQLVLGASVSMAVMGRKAPLWQAALTGAICGTLPDMDVFVDHGDAIRNMTLHRTESHSLFWLTLLSPILAWLIAILTGQRQQWLRWWGAVWLALITHPLLDLMTVYGTQLGLPFTNFPFAISSIYIVDPLYTLPLLICLVVALCLRGKRGLWWNTLGLTLSTLYLGWSVLAQSYATHQIKAEMARQHLTADQLLVTPTAFNTLVWRVLVMTPEGYAEGFWSLLSPQRPLQLSHHERGAALYQRYKANWYVERVAWFSHGFFAMREQRGHLLITDLRMGEDPHYTFTFDLGKPAQQQAVAASRQEMPRPSLASSFSLWWRRL
ncbi:inner membrane protein [Erwinia toletana]|uniref:Inner membrane protein n=1 Tax=Winslowiella toletana TaxID=92490 RepID=A0ABS4PDH1_9GAMM|nr:metal-dependent hydrolase [Winslowiella toletana]MBP2170684.1 inner membrane protein [Winslowiella toletana]